MYVRIFGSLNLESSCVGDFLCGGCWRVFGRAGSEWLVKPGREPKCTLFVFMGSDFKNKLSFILTQFMKLGLLLGGLGRNTGCHPCEAPSGSWRTL